ncbi:transcription initiation factor TFIID subunit 4-like [Trachypithecus francoisi]|uniref:transcription initiation factor TFIID subunit 4-like n=1 Tax=Trachypithecus francoisi TaxID=54180 RepID=UPI00141AC5E6|nr:transcription initiation factor TFIID subunit 4-like [Trachypithecus francoisi]
MFPLRREGAGTREGGGRAAPESGGRAAGGSTEPATAAEAGGGAGRGLPGPSPAPPAARWRAPRPLGSRGGRGGALEEGGRAGTWPALPRRPADPGPGAPLAPGPALGLSSLQ